MVGIDVEVKANGVVTVVEVVVELVNLVVDVFVEL